MALAALQRQCNVGRKWPPDPAQKGRINIRAQSKMGTALLVILPAFLAAMILLSKLLPDDGGCPTTAV